MVRTAAMAEHREVPEPLLCVSVEIEAGAPVAGWVREPSGRRQRFDGWLELMSALEHAIVAVANSETDQE